MLTSSSNQYLRPEYLTPLPTTLDAKKSPLALLAQTCSQIGADPLPPSSSSGSSSKTTSSLLSSLHDVSGNGSSSVGSSSTSSSSSMSSNSTSLSGSSNNNNNNNNSAAGNGNAQSSGSKKSKSSHHHVNVGVEHHPHQNHHRKSSSTSPSEGKGNMKGSGGGSGKHQLQEKQMEKDSGGGTRFTPPLLGGMSGGGGGNNGSASLSYNGAGSGRNSTSPHEKIRVKTPSSSGNKTSSGSPHLLTSTSNSSPRELVNKSPVTSGSGGSSVMGTGATSTSSSSTSSGSVAGAADTILSSKSSRDSPAAILRASPAFSTSSTANTLCPPLSVSSKLNLNGPLGCLTNSELSLSSLKAHGNPLPFPGLYPGLSSHAAAVSSANTTAGLPPYLHSYARLKAAAAANGTDHLAAAAAAAAAAQASGAGGGCRDPFCTGCQLGAPHLPSSLTGVKSCPAGCLQCDHHKNPFLSMNGCGTGGQVGQGFPFLPGFSIPPGFYSSAMANSSASQQPYVCNWIVGDTYCGKRFTSSDELLQHLRSHTSLSSAAAAAGQQSSAADPLAAYSQHPLFSGMNMNLNLSRTYPTPPLSPLSSARFHPYSKPGSMGGLSGLPSLSGLPGQAAAAAAAAAGLSSFNPPAGFSSLSHPLSPYYPYAAFYGQRLGSSSILHP